MINVSISNKDIIAHVSNKDIMSHVSQSSPEIDNSNLKVVKGDTGAVFTPHVDENSNLSWSNNGGLLNPPTANIRGERGEKGEKGDKGEGVVTPLTNLEIEAIMGGV